MLFAQIIVVRIDVFVKCACSHFKFSGTRIYYVSITGYLQINQTVVFSVPNIILYKRIQFNSK